MAAVNYYEVVFADSTRTEFYRVAGYKGQTLRLSVPADTYDNDTNGYAIVFAGHDPGNGDKTLLAIGKMTTPGNGVIDVDTTSIAFTLTALETDIATSFAVTAGDNGDPGTVNYDNAAVPCFFVHADTPAAEAAFIIGNMDTDATANVSGNTAFGDLVIPVNAGTLTSWGLVSSGGGTPLTVTPAVPATGLTAGTALGETGVITLTFATPAANGWSAISIDIPVNALANTVPNGAVWHIRGGLQNHVLDAGAADNSLGGAIVLGIGTVTPGIEISFQ
jgi:hypothetical protein